MASNWAIVIGINQYRFLQPLRYAKRDAEAMNEFLTQEAKFDRIFLFTDDSPEIGGKPTEPFRANLLRVLRQIFAQPFMKDGDSFWFFFSGHGIRHNEQDYLMPLDGDPEDVEHTGIPTNLITSYLRSCGADNVVMILDACRSGGKKSGEGIGKQTEEEARQTGVISIFSCSPYEYSYELESIAQGAFTYSLIEGLGIRGRCATVERLNQYLQNQVPQLVQQIGRVRQTPYTIAEPLNRSHLILMPQHASLADISTLKNDAYNAEIAKNWELARRLWLRVLVAASGQDMDAVNAIERIGQERMGRSQPPSNPPAQPAPSRFPRSVTPGFRAYFEPPSIQTTTKPSFLTSQPSSRRQLTRQQFLKWGVSAGIGAVGIWTIASQFLGDSSRQPSSVDYSKLEGFLKAGQWKEADQETANLMLKAANREEEGYLDSDSIKNFPCDVLSRIDRLWVDNSQGKFGFSVQKKIYIEECGGKPDGQYDEEAYQCFGNAVGWRVNNSWINYSELTLDTSAPMGHLPVVEGLGGRFSSGGSAGAEEARSASGSAVVGVVVWVPGVSSLVQKLVNCSI